MTEQPPAPSHLRGAVDLSSLAARPTTGASRSTAGPDGAEQASGSWIVRGVGEGELQQLIQLSARVPVLVHLRTSATAVSDQLDQLLTPAVNGRQGRLVLAEVDVDAHPQLLQVFGLTSGPAVIGILSAQPVPLLNQAVGADQLDSLLDELLQVAAQNGLTDTVPPLGPQEQAPADAPPAPPALPPLHQQAVDALAQGDPDAAIQAYRQALKENPGDDEAAVGLARVELMQRTATLDADAVRRAAADSPDDLEAQLRVADLDLVGGHVEDAFARLVRFIALHPGEDREAARAHLVQLYSVVGDQDPRTAASRRSLATALF